MATELAGPELFDPKARGQAPTWPHDGYRRRGRDPRLAEYLAVLAEVGAEYGPEALLKALCGGVWWLRPAQARELAGHLRRILEGG